MGRGSRRVAACSSLDENHQITDLQLHAMLEAFHPVLNYGA